MPIKKMTKWRELNLNSIRIQQKIILMVQRKSLYHHSKKKVSKRMSKGKINNEFILSILINHVFARNV